MTAHATESVRRRCAECGMDGFVSKPIDGARLLDRLDSHGHAARVLSVSGRPAQQRVMERAVQAAGAEVMAAQTFAEALSVTTQFRPHVLVVDLELPDGLGTDLVDRVRALGFAGPVLGCGDEAASVIWAEFGVLQFLTTPARAVGVQRALEGALAPGRAYTWDPSREIDPELQDLVPLFLEERRKDLGRIAEAMETEDAAALREIGHRIKGTGTSYGFPELTEAGAVLEEAAIAGDLEACKAPIEIIREAVS